MSAQPPPLYPQPQQQPQAEGATMALILGIVGLVLCQVCAPFAWYYGKRAEAAVDQSGGTLGGRGLATAGKILGIIGTVLLVLIGLLLIVGLIFLVAGSGSTSP